MSENIPPLNNGLLEVLKLWREAQSHEIRTIDAIALLIDAAAFGLNEGDYDPAPMLERLSKTFDVLHMAKYGVVIQ